MSNRYIGITIGPIYRTMQLTATPAGLWAASYLFSFIARTFCEKAIEKELTTKGRIISPYLEEKEVELPSGEIKKRLNCNKESVGLFHDRVYFKPSQEKGIGDVEQIIKLTKVKVIKEISNQLNKESEKDIGEFLNNYIEIRAVEVEIAENENPILVISPYLDALELESSFVQKEKTNYLINIFNNTSNTKGQNDNIKNSFLVKDVNPILKEETEKEKIKWSLYQEDGTTIKLIDDIAQGRQDNTYKRSQYYVLLQADGDNMGKTLEKVVPKIAKDKADTLDEKIRSFSKACFEYGKQAAQRIREYGGVTIYAGGDDLLLIAPVVGKLKEGKDGNVFDLVNEITEIFNTQFKTYIDEAEIDEKPALSWGITVQYKKYPLYEAFEQVGQLLYKAKKVQGKNTICFELQKHSGRRLTMVLPQYYKGESKDIYNRMSSLMKILTPLIESPEDEDKFLKSVNTKLMEYKEVIKEALRYDVKDSKERNNEILLKNAFKNIFDSTIHDEAQNREYINHIREMMWEFNKEEHQIKKDKEVTEEQKIEKVIKDIDSVIRISKFLVEKGGNEDA